MQSIVIDFMLGVASSILSKYSKGFVNTLVGYPMDFVKTRMQLQQTKHGTLKSIANIIKNEGAGALYRGVSIQLLNSVLAGSIYFTTYEQIRRKFEKINRMPPHSYLPLYQTFVAGSLAGIASDMFAIPFEYTKIQAQKQQVIKGQKVQSPLSILIQIVRLQGVKQIYKGSSLQIVRDSIGCGSFFLAHSETLQFFTPKGKSRNDASQFGIFMASISAGVGYWVISYPLDIIKTRFQADNQIKIISIISQLYNQGGLLQFYKGFKITVFRSVFVNIFQLYTYENLRRFAYSFSDENNKV